MLIVIRISLNAGAPDAHRTTLRHSIAEGASCTSLNLPTQDAPWQRVQPPLPGAAMLGGRPIAIKVSVSTTSDGSSDASSYRTSLSATFDPYSPGFAKEARDVEKVRVLLDYLFLVLSADGQAHL